MARLPHFLDHHRDLGVDHFLIVENDGTDGSGDWLAGQPDVSLWSTAAGYKAARFGVDWTNALLRRHGVGHWCLTLDADELLAYPHHETRDLRALTDRLDRTGSAGMGALMLDLYPRGPLDADELSAGDPLAALPWFDPGNYVALCQPRLGNLWVQGGPRARRFFASDPRRAPTLSKVPLIRWHRSYAYVSSTHSALPRRLNDVHPTPRRDVLTGVLLHTKFLPGIGARSNEEKARRQHFENSDLYDTYYDTLAGGPTLWCDASARYVDWRQLVGLGLMSTGGWA